MDESGSIYFETKLPAIAKVSVRHAMEETEACDAVKARWDRSNSNGPNVSVKTEHWQSHRYAVRGEGAGVGAGERNGLKRIASAKQAILFVKDEVETSFASSPNVLLGSGSISRRRRSISSRPSATTTTRPFAIPTNRLA
jgi:hypothetical protein